MSELEEGDTYIDDRLHYHLARIIQIIEPDDDNNGLWHWVIPISSKKEGN